MSELKLPFEALVHRHRKVDRGQSPDQTIKHQVLILSTADVAAAE